MERTGEQIACGAALAQTSGIHHGNRIAGLCDDAEIMRDQDNGQAAPVAQIEKEAEDLRLHRHIERGRRLIGDEEIRLAGKRQRDHRALAHAAGELMRKVIGATVGIGNADLLQEIDGGAPGLPGIGAAMKSHALGDLAADSS